MMKRPHTQPTTAAEEQTMLELAISLSKNEIASANRRKPGDVLSPIQRSAEAAQVSAPAPSAPPPTHPLLPLGNSPRSRLHAQRGDVAPESVESDISASDMCAACHKPLVPPRALAFLGLNAQQVVRIPRLPGMVYHAECLVCHDCGKRVNGKIAMHEGHIYHRECIKRLHAPFCACCKQHIQPEPEDPHRIRYIKNPFWKEKYCATHQANSEGVVACTSCMRLRSSRSDDVVPLGDSRHACLSCLESMVANTAEAQPLYHTVLAFFRSRNMAHPEVPPFMLVENSALNDYKGQEGKAEAGGGPITHTRGLCLCEHYEYIRVASLGRDDSGLLTSQSSSMALRPPRQTQHVHVSAILVLSGLPWYMTGAILAHELMHAWLRMKAYATLPLAVEEGLCQLMSYLWLEAQSDIKADSNDERLASFIGHSIRSDTSHVYGDGFRQALEAFQEHGLPSVLHHVKATQQFPAQRNG